MTAQPQSSMPWTKLPGGGYRCERHDTTFRPPRTCKACDADKGKPIDSVEKRNLPKPPQGCKTTAQHERWFNDLAKASLADAERLGALALELATPRPVAPEEVLFLSPDAPASVEPKMTKPTFNFHLEVNMAKHREVAAKCARAAAQLAAAREDDIVVPELERLKRREHKKERAH